MALSLSLLAVDHPGQEQKSQWLQIRRERPDYVTHVGLGCYEPGCDPRGSEYPFPNGKFHWCLVVRF